MAGLAGKRTVTDLWLVRHCQSMHQITGGLLQADVPLSTFGLMQATRLASYLSSFGRFNGIYSSPLQRARGTADRIAESLMQNLTVIDDLREIEFGEASGLLIEDFNQSWPELASRWEDPFDVDFQWPNGESRRDFHRRSLRAIDELVQTHDGGRLIIIAHTGNLCGYLARLLMGEALLWRQIPLGLGSISRIEIGSGFEHLLLLGDVSHLGDLIDNQAI